ncbi:MAG: polyprenyl synthetase family protein [Pseudomonas sp.]
MSSTFERCLADYREQVLPRIEDLLSDKAESPLYELICDYPKRGGKGFRAALCLATCLACGANRDIGEQLAASIELFHSGFLVHDDIQDGSELRRGRETMHALHGIPIAINIGHALNLLGFRALLTALNCTNQGITGRIVEETYTMLEHSLEGQAMELAWIRDNAIALDDQDYLRMCLKKTSWYTCIYPMRVGVLLAGRRSTDDWYRFGWYLGAAFQIQDDYLNLVGQEDRYGKEIGGDLLEGKRTLMLLHYLRHAPALERERAREFLVGPRSARSTPDQQWLLRAMHRTGSIEYARSCARRLAGAALFEALCVLRDEPVSIHKQFLLDASTFVVQRTA